MRLHWAMIALAGWICISAASAQPAGNPKLTTASVLDELQPLRNGKINKTGNEVVLTGMAGRFLTERKFVAPLTITTKAKTDSNNLRLVFGKGMLIFNWEMRGTEFRYHDPITGKGVGVANQGAIPSNKWVTVTWVIDTNRSRVLVDGVERYSIEGDFSGVSGQVGFELMHNTTLVESITVTSDPNAVPMEKPTGRTTRTTPDRGGLNRPTSVTPAPAVRQNLPGNGINIAIQTTPPGGGTAVTDAGTPVDPNSIERPEYLRKAKSLQKSLTTVTSMMVIVKEDGAATGFTSDIIATVRPESRSGASAGIGFYRSDVDETMKRAFEESVRAVQLRYPYWEPGQIDISFGEKFTGHGGPSAGTAFALLALSTLEGFEIDPKCAVTGDITVDWKVRKVGGVTAKLRGAFLEKIPYALIPSGNVTAFKDMAVLYGPSAIYGVQVFSIERLQDAIAIVRKDRASALADAMNAFAELQKELSKAESANLKKPATIKSLKAILELAPNHESARQLLAIAEGNAATTLSSTATMYQLSQIFYPYQAVLAKLDAIDRESLPSHVTAATRGKTSKLRAMASKELIPLINDMSAFIESIDAVAGKTGNLKTLLARKKDFEARIATTFGDASFMEKIVHEGY